MENPVHSLSNIIRSGERIVFFGGAGVSTESAIPDFRSASGLYRQSDNAVYAPEEILHRDFFIRNPEAFYQYYFTNMVYPNAKPNAAHAALAELESRGSLAAVITQNIDGLHQSAGSKRVIELHGSVHQNHCIQCGVAYSLEKILINAPHVPLCTICGGIIKPNVVLYGEALPEDAVSNALAYIARADVLIIGGTSLSVYPAAGFINYFNGKSLVLINKDETAYDELACLVIRQKIGEVMEACVTILTSDS